MFTMFTVRAMSQTLGSALATSSVLVLRPLPGCHHLPTLKGSHITSHLCSEAPLPTTHIHTTPSAPCPALTYPGLPAAPGTEKPRPISGPYTCQSLVLRHPHGSLPSLLQVFASISPSLGGRSPSAKSTGPSQGPWDSHSVTIPFRKKRNTCLCLYKLHEKLPSPQAHLDNRLLDYADLGAVVANSVVCHFFPLVSISIFANRFLPRHEACGHPGVSWTPACRRA